MSRIYVEVESSPHGSGLRGEGFVRLDHVDPVGCPPVFLQRQFRHLGLAGHAGERIIEVHGTMHRAMCWGCGQRTPMADVLERLRAGEADPACRACAAS